MFDASSLDDNAGAGYEVVSVAVDALTIDTTATTVNDDEIMPWAPTDTPPTGQPVVGLSGSLKMTPSGLSQVTVPVTAFEMTIDQGLAPITNRVGSDVVPDVIEGERRVTGTITLRLRRDMINFLAHRNNVTVQNVTVVLGPAAGRRAEVTFPVMELGFAAPNVPDADVAIVTFPFTALENAADDNEVALELF